MCEYLNSSNIDSIVNATWKKVKDSVEKNNWSLSSEKTLVFKFMWELSKLVEEDRLRYDFEYMAYDSLEGKDKFLDLLVWTSENYKIAFEFKFPKKNNSGNSNQTETRKNIYKDISRLKYLIDNNVNNIKKGYFLAATNEDAYINRGVKLTYPDLMVYNNYKYSGGAINNYDEINYLPQNFMFKWENIDTIDSKHKVKGFYAWLQPIIV